MKLVIVSFVSMVALSGTAFAHETTGEKADKTAQSGEAHSCKDKNCKHKKGEMCSECGKAGHECSCHGHKDGEGKKEHKGH